MKHKYFNLADPIQIEIFDSLKKPMGWHRLTEENILLKSSYLTVTEIKKLRDNKQCQ